MNISIRETAYWTCCLFCFWLLLSTSSLVATTRGRRGTEDECTAVRQAFLASTQEADSHLRHNADANQKPLQGAYIELLRSFGFKQAAGEIDVIWDRGYVELHASNIRFSDSYQVIRSPSTGTEGLIPSQADLLR